MAVQPIKTNQNSNPIITAKELTIAYQDRLIVKNADFTINFGDYLAIIGDNGIGKTSLIKTILNNRQANLTINTEKTSYVPQFRDVPKDYPLSVFEFIRLGLTKQRLILTTNDKKRINELIEMLDLTDLANQRLGLLSGGQKQRAYIAQSLVNEPELLILDEAGASLDQMSKIWLFELLDAYRQKNHTTILFVTHDLDLAPKYVDGFLVMNQGGIQKMAELI